MWFVPRKGMRGGFPVLKAMPAAGGGAGEDKGEPSGGGD